MVENVGAKVVFCDIDPKTFNLDIVQLASVINKNSKAIIPVHLFGLAAEMDEIARISAENNLLVIEDAACGFGARYNGKHVGTFGEFGCFSFHPRKAITTGEGGMVTCKDDKLFSKNPALTRPWCC